jgi:adenine phosphoribosyltransferase
LQKNAIQPQERVVLIDDVLATGGTLKAGCQLIKQAGAHVVGCVVVLELVSLAGRERFGDYPLKTLLTA